MSPALPVRALWLVAALIGCPLAMAQRGRDIRNAPPVLDVVVGRMQEAADTIQPESLRVIREYLLAKGTSGEVVSRVLAQFDYASSGTKQYSIRETTGSSRGQEIVKQVLDHEVAPAESRKVAVNSENYDFQFAGQTFFAGESCYLLRLNPKRKDAGLISGQAWVDQHSFRIRHIEGQLVKPPSWWLKNVSVEITFDNVQGRWVQTATKASADVRMLGVRTLTSQLLTYAEGQGPAIAQVPKNPRRSSGPGIPAEVLLLPLHNR
jgi:hypothetical protein